MKVGIDSKFLQKCFICNHFQSTCNSLGFFARVLWLSSQTVKTTSILRTLASPYIVQGITTVGKEWPGNCGKMYYRILTLDSNSLKTGLGHNGSICFQRSEKQLERSLSYCSRHKRLAHLLPFLFLHHHPN